MAASSGSSGFRASALRTSHLGQRGMAFAHVLKLFDLLELNNLLPGFRHPRQSCKYHMKSLKISDLWIFKWPLIVVILNSVHWEECFPSVIGDTRSFALWGVCMWKRYFAVSNWHLASEICKFCYYKKAFLVLANFTCCHDPVIYVHVNFTYKRISEVNS